MLSSQYLDQMKKFEGFSSRARWDYAQNSNGYGTRARFAGEIIDKDEAERRFAAAVSQASDLVERFAPHLDAGTKAALTSLTYNAGTAWMQNGLGEAIQTGDIEKARSLFVMYNKAGGMTLDGLVQRRMSEVSWFGQGAQAVASSAASFADPPALPAAVAEPSMQAADTATASIINAHPSTGSSVAANPSDSGSARDRGPNIGSDSIILSLLALISKTGTEVRGDADTGDKGVAKTDVPLASA